MNSDQVQPKVTSYSLNFISATTSESPSPGTTATTMVPNPTTTMNQQTIMTTQPSMSQDTDVTVVQDIDDTTTDIPMMLEAMGKGWLISECILSSFRSSIRLTKCLFTNLAICIFSCLKLFVMSNHGLLNRRLSMV